MEHTCYRCGAAVEDGVAFCTNCNAPQIRVTAPAGNDAATQPLEPGTPEAIQPTARPAAYPAAVPAQGLQWHDAMPGALLAGAVVALVMVVPFGAYLLWPVAAGVLAIFLYKRRNPGAEISGSAGARLGAIAGLFTFIVFAVLMGVELAASGSKLRDQVMQVMQQSAARNPSPEAQEMVQKLMTPEGIALMVVIVFVMFLAIFVGLSSLGGAVGARLLKKRESK